MKTKKLITSLLSSVTEFILDSRSSSSSEIQKKLSTLQGKINEMHINNLYSMELFSSLAEKEQYGIQKKLTSKANRPMESQSNGVLIRFKLIEKINSNMCLVQTWHITADKIEQFQSSSKNNCDQEAIYLLEEIIRALKCQFLMSFIQSSQQLKNKYILDYEIDLNPSKKILDQISMIDYQQSWQKRAKVDKHHTVYVSCYHNFPSKIKSIIEQNSKVTKIKSRYHALNAKPLKNGSQQTKPSFSSEHQLSEQFEITSKDSIMNNRRESLIEFYDQELDITVLSNDSDSFKKSTGKLEGIYMTHSEQITKAENDSDSDDQFELLVEENQTIELPNESSKFNTRILELQKQCFSFLEGIQTLSDTYFN